MGGRTDDLRKIPLVRYSWNEAILKKKPERADKKVERNGEIQRLHREGVSISEIGRRYGISRQRVFQIVTGKK